MNPDAREFLRIAASALRAYTLYPAGHPVRSDYLQQLLAVARRLSESQGSFDVFLHEGSLFFGEELMTKESLTLQWMMRSLEARGITSFTVRSGVSFDELAGMMDHFAGEGPEPVGNVAVNAASLIGQRANTSGQLYQIRAAYSDALDLVRDIGTGVSEGRPAAIGQAKSAVEGLIEGVLADRDSGILLSTMRAHDEHTFFHMVNVCILAVATGTAIGLGKDSLVSLGLGAILHDMGKVGVPHEILNKAGSLSDEEWAAIRKHPIEGAGLILGAWDKIDPRAAVIAYEHHLRLDGSGYPSVRLEAESDLLSRIVTVADTFDAITSRRSYRRAEQRQKALDVLLSGAGAHYDSRIVKVFVRMMGFYPPGSVVELSDGSIAVVVKNNEESLGRPVVKVVVSPSGESIQPLQLDLSRSDELSISRGVKPEAARIEAADLL